MKKTLGSLLAASLMTAAGTLSSLSPTYASAILESPWAGSGPGTVTVVSDGSTQPAEMTYSLSGGAVYSTQTWTFSTAAGSTGVRNLNYNYSGFHAYYEVTVFLQAFVTHNGVTTYTPLVNDGPENCCTAPSGGFSYTGSVSLNVQSGDTYGFTFGGSNYDSDAVLQGTLQVSSNYVTSGFLAPVQNAPTVNVGKAGRTYPLKWQLQDANGQYISTLSAVQNMQVNSVACDTWSGDPSTATSTDATGGTSLRYDSTSNQYVYNWQSPSSAGCYVVTVTLDSGQTLTADFNLS